MRISLAGLALESATSSGLGRAPALQCRTPSRHHLELQDRRDYTPADRAARTCCDEAHFWLNGYVNKQNCRIWSEANPQVYVETPLHPEKTDCLVRFMGWWNPSSKTMKAITLQSMVIGKEP
ncbi:uncharacterized protein TNCV_2422621 [Trichonephila clavipes]|nr:uncharacterized protein TNCV_2422621 [Trichonephila clavipes]